MAFAAQICRTSRFTIFERNFMKNAVCYHFMLNYRSRDNNREYFNCKRKSIDFQRNFNERYFSSEKDNKGTSEQTRSEDSADKKPSQRARLKQAIKNYGATIIVFHVTISLASLGICYLAVSNGVDVISLLTKVGFSESVTSSKMVQEGSTFAISYAVHKLFAPVRIGITLSTAPFIVRYLRKINVIKPPKTS